MIIIEIIINLTQIVEVTQVWKNEGATLDRKVMVRTIIIEIVSARGAKTPSIMV